MGRIKDAVKSAYKDVANYSRIICGLELRGYQIKIARSIIQSIKEKRGDTIVVIMPRQSGKNELQAIIESYLITVMRSLDVEIVKISPTWKPQSLNAMRRLEKHLSRNKLRIAWFKNSGYIYRVGQARVIFLSGAADANIVGATANLLLSVDESQDILIDKYDRDISPMAASSNCTRVFWGTAWTPETLLARELRHATKKFIFTADDVVKEVPAYGIYVAEQVNRHGRNHPIIKTQYYSEEIGASSSMFTPERMALMQGEHAASSAPGNGIYAMLIDVAGVDEGSKAGGSVLESYEKLANVDRDSTTVTICEVDLSNIDRMIEFKPSYHVLYRRSWVGISHSSIFKTIVALANLWMVKYLVIDATGIGAGIASFLEAAMPGRVIPFIFSLATKSKLGWDFISIIETGRYKEHFPEGNNQAEFWDQLRHCDLNVMNGPGKIIKWGVPDGVRDSHGNLMHDDWVMSAALVSVLDEQTWGVARSISIEPNDPIEGMTEAY